MMECNLEDLYNRTGWFVSNYADFALNFYWCFLLINRFLVHYHLSNHYSQIRHYHYHLGNRCLLYRSCSRNICTHRYTVNQIFYTNISHPLVHLQFTNTSIESGAGGRLIHLTQMIPLSSILQPCSVKFGRLRMGCVAFLQI